MGFRPLTGMVPQRRTRENETQSFRPLMGMVLGDTSTQGLRWVFRPLTGMVQLEKVYTKEDPKFLSPYGDGTKQFGEEFTKIQFSPPYGDGTSHFLFQQH